jgi:hypothetical protein
MIFKEVKRMQEKAKKLGEGAEIKEIYRGQSN